MKPFSGIPGAPSAAGSLPTSCPSCRSTLIVTSAQRPDAESYWRCTNCGEVWNASRAPTGRQGGRWHR